MTHLAQRLLWSPQALHSVDSAAWMQSLLLVQAELVRAQAMAGLVPHKHAQSIIGTCRVELFDVLKLERDSVNGLSLITPLLHSLRESVALFNPDAAPFVNQHWSAGDWQFTALAHLSQQSLRLLLEQVGTLRNLWSGRQPLPRQHLQATWAAFEEAAQSLQQLAPPALCIRLHSLQPHVSAVQYQTIAEQLAQNLGMNTSHEPAPARNDLPAAWLALACQLGLMVRHLGELSAQLPTLPEQQALPALVQANALRTPDLLASLLMPAQPAPAPFWCWVQLDPWLGLLGSALTACRGLQLQIQPG